MDNALLEKETLIEQMRTHHLEFKEMRDYVKNATKLHNKLGWGNVDSVLTEFLGKRKM